MRCHHTLDGLDGRCHAWSALCSLPLAHPDLLRARSLADGGAAKILELGRIRHEPCNHSQLSPPQGGMNRASNSSGSMQRCRGHSLSPSRRSGSSRLPNPHQTAYSKVSSDVRGSGLCSMNGLDPRPRDLQISVLAHELERIPSGTDRGHWRLRPRSVPLLSYLGSVPGPPRHRGPSDRQRDHAAPANGQSESCSLKGKAWG